VCVWKKRRARRVVGTEDEDSTRAEARGEREREKERGIFFSFVENKEEIERDGREIIIIVSF
jgi:hypothetical protein|tara:strand:+ start:274 stop:459 length:186 start_codon:yes stop_codon:yes gene_type:complete